MTEQELQSVINAVLSSIKTNSRSIGQLTGVQTLSDNDCFEVAGGRKIAYSVLRDLIYAAVKAKLENMQTDIANSVLQSVSFDAKSSTATLTIKQKGYDAITVSVPIATDSQSGIMTAADKAKLDNTYTKDEINAKVDEINKDIAKADAKWTDIVDGEAMSVDCVKQIRFLTLTVIGDVYDSMSLDGVKNVMALTATYDDRSAEPITEFTVTGVVKAGNQNFIATYNGIKASLAVEVLHRTATLASIRANSSVNEVPMWTETEELRKYKTVLKVYSDSTTELTKDYTLSGVLQQGASTITVSYDGGTTKTTTLTFTGVNDGSYVTDSLEAMVDFSDYADGYTGEIIDKAKGHQVVLNASLANAETKAPYGGIHGGKLVQAQWYEGTSSKGLAMDIKGCAPAGVVTVELYARIRGKYSGSGATPTIGAISTFIMAMSSFAISPNSAYVNECRYAPQGEINLKGPAAKPDITTSGLNLPYYDSSHTDVRELVHIVYTIANKLQKLYVNGQLIIDDSKGGYSCTGGTDVRIFPHFEYVAADIAVVRVYGKALNNKEVQRNYLNCQAKHGSQIN